MHILYLCILIREYALIASKNVYGYRFLFLIGYFSVYKINHLIIISNWVSNPPSIELFSFSIKWTRSGYKVFSLSSTELTFLPKWTGRGSKVVRPTQQWINLPPKVDRKRKLRSSGPPINELILLSKWTGRGSKVFRPTQQWIGFLSKVDRKRIKGFPAHPPRQWVLSQSGSEKEARFSGSPSNQLICLQKWTGSGWNDFRPTQQSINLPLNVDRKQMYRNRKKGFP